MTKRFNIVAQKHCNREPYLPGVLAGVDALLVREPDNAYDAFAVAVYVGGEQVGYLSKRENVEIAKRIDAESKTLGQACTDSGITFDAALKIADNKVMRARFVRSANSGYPQIEID